MITLQRTDYAFAELNATPEEWEGIKTIVQSAVDNYDTWDIDFSIPGPAEKRKTSLESMAERLMVSELPVTIDREDIAVLLAVARQADREQVPNMDRVHKDEILDEFSRYNIHALFGGEWNPEQPFDPDVLRGPDI